MPDAKIFDLIQYYASNISKEENFWFQALTHTQPTNLPFLPLEFNTKKNQYKAETLWSLDLPENLRQKLSDSFSKKYNLAEILLSIFLTYLFRINYQEERISIGWSDTNLLQKIKPLNPFLANHLPLSMDLKDAQTLEQVIVDLQTQLAVLNQKQTHLQDIYIRYPKLTNIPRLQITAAIVDKFDDCSFNIDTPIILLISSDAKRIQLIRNIESNLDLDFFLQSIKGHLSTLLDSIINDPLQNIAQLELLTKAESQKILIDWNKTEADYPKDKTIHQLFEEQVEKTPNNIAVIYEEVQLTYHELNKRANQLAHYLRETYQIKPDDLIALCLDRSEHMIVAILAVLKAGGAYVPIDPEYPDKRIEYILGDTKAKALLTNKIYVDKLQNIPTNESIKSLGIDDEIFLEELEKEKSDNLIQINKSNDLAYVIYTSGTTGQPKGVMIEHCALVGFCINNNFFKVNTSSNVLGCSSYAFDGSVFDIFYSLSNGAKLILIDKNSLLDVNLLRELILKNKADTAFITTALFKSYLDLKKNNPLLTLKNILFGGEKLTIGTESIALLISQGKNIIHVYGPTENIVFSTYCPLTLSNLDKLPIGQPLSDKKIYVLDKNLQLLPMGVTGELYVGGLGVARGYLNNSIFTVKKFIKNPYSRESQFFSDKIYKTGDLVRWSHKGNLEYIKRIGSQIKINGYRIECEEIESKLMEYPGIKQAVVRMKDQYLIAYYVAEKKLNESQIFEYLTMQLPRYMLPMQMIYLPSFPLTINGKLDENALPSPGLKITQNYIAPRDELEKKICYIWKEILGLKKIGIQDDFFNVGGDSILAIQLISRLRQQLKLEINVKNIFSYKSIGKLYDYILAQKREGDSTLKFKTEQGVLTGQFPLSPIQKWFFNNNFVKPNHWNQSFLIKVPLLDINKLKVSINRLIEHHDVLRLRFNKDIEYYDPSIQSVLLNILDIRTLHIKENSIGDEIDLELIFTEWQSHFNLKKGPLFNIGYIYGYKNNSARIYFAAHHLIIDSVSWRILTEDLNKLYNEQLLGPKGSSYRQWINTLKEYTHIHTDEKKYWAKILSSYKEYKPSLNELVFSNEKSCSFGFSLNVNQTQKLLRESHKTYHTQINDLLLSGLAYALSEITKSKKNYITLEAHGREDIDNNINIARTIGWFTTMYPVCLEVNENIVLTIKNIKENLRAVPNKGVGFGGLLGYSIEKLPKISFNYLGQFNQTENFWAIIDEASGTTIDPSNQDYNIINIMGWVIDGKFKFNLTSRLEPLTTEKLANSFKKNLEEIISHCTKQVTIEYTPSDFKHVENEALLAELPLISTSNQFDWFEMTEMQKSYLLGRLNNYEIGNISNHIYEEFQYESLDTPRLEKVLNLLIEKYSALRVVYSLLNLQQKYLSFEEVGKYKIHLNDYTKMNLNSENLEQIRSKLSHKIYNTEKFPLFTFEVSQFKNCYVLHISIDLILLDVESRRLFSFMLNKLYRNENSTLNVPSISFKNYQDYYKFLKYSAWYARDKAYWEEKIPLMPLRPELPFKMQPNEIISPRFRASTLYIEKETWLKFTERARKHNLSHSSILLSLYCSVISYFSGYKEFLVTLTLFNRHMIHEEVNAILGDFTSTSLFHYKDFTPDFMQTFQRTHDVLWEDIHHALFSGIEVQRELVKIKNLDINKAVSPIVFTNIINKEKNEAFLEDTELKNKRYWIGQTSQAWIDLQAIEECGGFTSKWLYVEQLFNTSYIENLNKLYCDLIKFYAENDWEEKPNLLGLPIEDLTLIENANDSTQVLSNNTLFSNYEQFIVKHNYQERLAIVDCASNNKEYTYKTLLKDSEILAQFITQKMSPLQTESQLIAILSEKGYNHVVGPLSIMKAGFAYLPLNIEWPLGRLNEILEQAGVSLLLISAEQYANENLKNMLSSQYQCIIVEQTLENLNNLIKQKKILETVLPEVKPDDIAYVIYTSGTTGKPKGVTITHRGALNTIDAVNKEFKVTNQDTILALSALSFDLSVYDIFGLLAVGGKIIFPQHNKTKEFKYLLELIKQYKITLWNTVPQLAQLLADEMQYYNISFNYLRLFLLSGDWVPIGLSDKIKQQCHKAKVISLGGATEGSIWSIWYEINKIHTAWHTIPYGRAMPNQKMYILNQNHEHCPVEVVGEIYIGGLGVALNYYRDPEKTAESFIQHPQLGKLYKTGDLGKWQKNGYIEFMGRQDAQIKINGYRIELEEISAKLIQIGKVTEAVTLIHKKNNLSFIISYYIGDEINTKKTTRDLKNFLPNYMIPRMLIHLKSWPLTSNGKIDREKLPIMGLTNHNFYEPPKNEPEKLICETFSSVLSLAKIGRNDDFFQLGGDSIKAITLVSKLQANFKINVADIFNLKTPKNIAREILFLKDNLSLKVRLEKIKSLYKTNNYTKAVNLPSQKRLDNYLASINKTSAFFQKKYINHVLLTGSTGYLGSNLLNQLLNLTDYKIYLLIRASSNNDAFDRANKKHKFYFDKDLHQYKGTRIFTFAADLQQSKLALREQDYKFLVNKIDSIIHAAALTKHYGEYKYFYSANVQATINLLDLSILTKLKDFHYISTSDVLNIESLSEAERYIFTEDDHAENLKEPINYYKKTKYEAEKKLENYWRKGVSGSIYRVGNLAYIASNLRAQENIDDNAFISNLKCQLLLKITAQEFGEKEISPVDLTAEAIVILFDKKQVDNNIYHIFNPNLFNIAEFFSTHNDNDELSVKVLPINDFINSILDFANNPSYQKLVEKFLLHQNWLEENNDFLKQIQILEKRTNVILGNLGFQWPKITTKEFQFFLENFYLSSKH